MHQQQAALDWLAAQGERSGFTLLDTSVDAYRQQQLWRENSRQLIQFSSVDYTGMLTVTDPGLFLQRLSGVWQKPRVRLWSDADQTRSRGVTFVPLSPIPLKDRTSMIFLQYGQIDVLDGARADRQNRDPHAHSGGIGRLHYARTGNESFPRGGASGRHGGDATGLGR